MGVILCSWILLNLAPIGHSNYKDPFHHLGSISYQRPILIIYLVLKHWRGKWCCWWKDILAFQHLQICHLVHYFEMARFWASGEKLLDTLWAWLRSNWLRISITQGNKHEEKKKRIEKWTRNCFTDKITKGQLFIYLDEVRVGLCTKVILWPL